MEYNKGKNNPMYGTVSPNRGKTGIKSTNWKGGFPRCKSCNKELSRRDAKLCGNCSRKSLKTNYKDGRTHSKCYCIKCKKNVITWQTFYYGNKTCARCATKGSKKMWVTKSLKGKKRPEHSKTMSGRKTGSKTVNHHIYLKENSDKTMTITARNHQKLHQRAYDYLIKLGLIDNYIKWFIKKYGR
jgi:hypothetical protein